MQSSSPLSIYDVEQTQFPSFATGFIINNYSRYGTPCIIGMLIGVVMPLCFLALCFSALCIPLAVLYLRTREKHGENLFRYHKDTDSRVPTVVTSSSKPKMSSDSLRRYLVAGRSTMPQSLTGYNVAHLILQKIFGTRIFTFPWIGPLYTDTEATVVKSAKVVRNISAQIASYYPRGCATSYGLYGIKLAIVHFVTLTLVVFSLSIMLSRVSVIDIYRPIVFYHSVDGIGLSKSHVDSYLSELG